MSRRRLTTAALVLALVAPLAVPANGQDDRPATVPPACRVLPLPDHRTAFLYRGTEVAAWHFGPQYPRPFFFPFLSEHGTRLTRMGHPGAPNHDHHRSIWFAHHKVAGVDIWGDGGKGWIRQKQWLAYEDGAKEAVMAVLLRWYGGDGRELMEQEVVAAWRPGAGQGRELELQLTFRPKAESLELEKTNFGFLGVRMAKELSVHFGNGQLRDSEGRKGEREIFSKRAAWVDYSGPTAAVPKGREGIAFFDHPANPRYPTHWHVREDGWMGASFCLAEGYALKKEAPLVLRYLLLAHSGQTEASHLDTVAERFGARPGFEVEKSKRPHRQFEVQRKPAKPEATPTNER